MEANHWLRQASPLVAGLLTYDRHKFSCDLIAGLIVAIMLVPQSMAYAMLAGLPPQVGLYASIVPLLLYSLFGSSNSLAVGPVAMVSILVLSGVGELAAPGSQEFVSLCLTLALMVGVLQLAMAAFRLGFLVNFISHPVLVGFTSAAALVIGFSQFKHFFGMPVSKSEYPILTIFNSLASLVEANPTTVLIGVMGVAILVFFGNFVATMLKRIGASESVASTISKVGPLVAVAGTSLFVWSQGLQDNSNVAVVGEIPAGLPRLTLPSFEISTLIQLFPLALVITLVGYLESISVAKALASKKRESVSPNRELFALGLADIGAAFTGGYPVTGGFSRSLVNFSAGVATPVGSLITALLVALSVALLTPWFYYIPNAVLAAIIIVAVYRLVDFHTPRELWRYSRPDAIALVVTFLAVLTLGIETGIAIGVGTSILMMIHRMSQPHVAEVGRLGDTEHFRNILRHEVETVENVMVLRIDECLNFVNAPFLESYVIEKTLEKEAVKSVLLISSGINDVDATGVEILGKIRSELQDAGIEFYLSDVKGPVMDKLQLAGLDQEFLETNVFLSASQAMNHLEEKDSSSLGRNSSKQFNEEKVDV